MKNPTDPLLTGRDVATLFAVDPKTVVRWARTGTLHSIRLPSGHRRYPLSAVREVYEAGGGDWADTTL